MPKITSSTKPLKPYRRGETLGKASRSGKPSKASSSYVKPIAIPLVVKTVIKEDQAENAEEEEEENDEEDEEEGEEEEIAFDDEELLGEEEEKDEDAMEEDEKEAIKLPAAPMKRKSGKKGKKFIESQVCCFLFFFRSLFFSLVRKERLSNFWFTIMEIECFTFTGRFNNRRSSYNEES